mgnify:CR=1 FL=1
MKSVRVVVSGRVQGVWYRAWTEKEALARGLDGWVRNRSDGTVEAVFSGADADIDAMLAACRTGPPLARVEDVVTAPCAAPERGFAKRATV